MPDGSIVFDTRIDNTQAAKDLQKLEKKIQETEKTIESLTAQKKEAQKTSAFSAAELDKEKASLMEIKDRLQEIRSLSRDKTLDVGTREAYKGMIPGVQTELQEQQARVNALQSEYNKVYDSVGRYDQKLQEANTSLENQKANAQMLTEEIQRSNSPIAKFGQRVREAGDDMGTLENRIKRLASRVFVFSMITAALRSFRTWMGKVIKTDSEATAAMAKLKGALLTMVQPLVNVIIPAFVTFVNLLTHIATTAAEIMSGLFGQTIEQSSEAAKGLYEETEALEATGDAAKDAEKFLAGFDEINKVSGDEKSGAGAKKEEKTSADFTGLISEGLGAVEGIVGTALLAIGAILTFTGANVPLGIGLMAIGAATLAATITANSDKIVEMLQGPIGAVIALISGALLAIGAILLFSGVNIPLGLGLIAAGAVGLTAVTAANWDSIEKNLKQPISAVIALISGILLVLGVLLAFSGVNIPLGIGLIAAGAVGLVTAASVNWRSLANTLKGPMGAVVAVISGVLLAIGVVLAFSGINLPLGIALIAAGAVGLVSVAALNWDSISDALKGPIGEVVAIVSGILLALGSILAFSGTNLPLGIALMAAGAIGLVTVVSLNWNTIQDALQGPMGAVVASVSGALLVLGAIFAFTGVNLPLGIALMAAGAVGLATVVALNWEAIPELMRGPVGVVTAIVGGALLALGAILALSGVNIPLGLALMAAGGVALATAIAPNWDAILEKIKEAWEKIKSWWIGTAVPGLKSIPNFFIKNVINKLLAGAENFINFFIDGINGLIGKLNSFGFDLPEILGGGHIGFNIRTLGNISLPRVPALASGAVIPPNREFMAVLGDQRHGNNIEAPEDLIRQIVREEGGGNNAAILRQILAAIKEGKVMMVNQTVFAQLVSSSSDSEGFRLGDPMVTVH